MNLSHPWHPFSRSSVVALGIALILISFSGCKKAPPAPAQTAPEVEVITVTTQTIPDEPEFIGQTQAFRPVEIRPQVTGIIKKVFFLPRGEMSRRVTNFT